MKKFFVLMFLTFLFLANAYGELQVRGPSVIATTESVEGQDSYVTEIYYWDTKSESYKLEGCLLCPYWTACPCERLRRW